MKESIKGFAESLTKEQSAALVSKILGPPKRELMGEEKERITKLLKSRKPIESSDNQHIACDVYKVRNKIYHWYTGSGIDIIEEILPEDF